MARAHHMDEFEERKDSKGVAKTCVLDSLGSVSRSLRNDSCIMGCHSRIIRCPTTSFRDFRFCCESGITVSPF